MPYLGDYLGHLLSEVTMARLQADVEAVRIAEMYAEHPLLRTMPVPRFRLPEVDLDVPVVINELEQPPEGSSRPSITDLRAAFDGVLTAQVKQHRVPFPAAVRSKLNQALDRTAIELTKPGEIEIDLARVATEFSNVAIRMLSETVEPEKLSEFEKELRTMVNAEFLKKRTLRPRLDALITTAQVREAGPTEVLTHLRLKLVEESFEWTTVGDDTEKRDRLVIE